MNRTPNPAMVLLAREFRDMTQEQLARKLFISQATVAKLEGGVSTSLADEKVGQLARALGFPVEFFYQPEERLGFGSSSFFYRKKAQISAVDRKRITGVVNLVRIHLKKLLSSTELVATRKLPEFDVEMEKGPLGAARLLRALWALPDGPIFNLTELIEDAGVLVIACDFGTRAMDATSIRVAELPPLIFINRDLPGDRWRFTLAHELGHLVLHPAPKETMEEEADAFAAELLMPEQEMRAQFARMPRIRLQDLANLKPFWKTSIASLLYQATKVGALSSRDSRALWMQLSKLGYRTQEPLPLERESPKAHPGLIRYMRETVGLTFEELAASVLWNSEEFAELHGVELPPTRKLQLVR